MLSGHGRIGPHRRRHHGTVSLIERFRELHRTGIFMMPNPWDRGSARVLADMGFPALATTSAGLGRSLGRDDQQVTREELVAHVAELTTVIDVPLNVDGERLYPDQSGGVAETVRLLAAAGASGCSIEDYDPATGAIDPLPVAESAVAEAARECSRWGLVLTARAENHLYGVADLDDTIDRLSRYAAAGAEVVYAPGLTDAVDISRVVAETGRPVNVLALDGCPGVSELRAMGVRRVSTGARLHTIAHRALVAEARRLSGDVPTEIVDYRWGADG